MSHIQEQVQPLDKNEFSRSLAADIIQHKAVALLDTREALFQLDLDDPYTCNKIINSHQKEFDIFELLSEKRRTEPSKKTKSTKEKASSSDCENFDKRVKFKVPPPVVVRLRQPKCPAPSESSRPHQHASSSHHTETRSNPPASRMSLVQPQKIIHDQPPSNSRMSATALLKHFAQASINQVAQQQFPPPAAQLAPGQHHQLANNHFPTISQLPAAHNNQMFDNRPPPNSQMNQMALRGNSAHGPLSQVGQQQIPPPAAQLAPGQHHQLAYNHFPTMAQLPAAHDNQMLDNRPPPNPQMSQTALLKHFAQASINQVAQQQFPSSAAQSTPYQHHQLAYNHIPTMSQLPAAHDNQMVPVWENPQCSVDRVSQRPTIQSQQTSYHQHQTMRQAPLSHHNSQMVLMGNTPQDSMNASLQHSRPLASQMSSTHQPMPYNQQQGLPQPPPVQHNQMAQMGYARNPPAPLVYAPNPSQQPAFRIHKVPPRFDNVRFNESSAPTKTAHQWYAEQQHFHQHKMNQGRGPITDRHRRSGRQWNGSKAGCSQAQHASSAFGGSTEMGNSTKVSRINPAPIKAYSTVPVPSGLEPLTPQKTMEKQPQILQKAPKQEIRKDNNIERSEAESVIHELNEQIPSGSGEKTSENSEQLEETVRTPEEKKDLVSSQAVIQKERSGESSSSAVETAQDPEKPQATEDDESWPSLDVASRTRIPKSTPTQTPHEDQSRPSCSISFGKKSDTLNAAKHVFALKIHPDAPKRSSRQFHAQTRTRAPPRIQQSENGFSNHHDVRKRLTQTKPKVENTVPEKKMDQKSKHQTKEPEAPKPVSKAQKQPALSKELASFAVRDSQLASGSEKKEEAKMSHKTLSAVKSNKKSASTQQSSSPMSLRNTNASEQAQSSESSPISVHSDKVRESFSKPVSSQDTSSSISSAAEETTQKTTSVQPEKKSEVNGKTEEHHTKRTSKLDLKSSGLAPNLVTAEAVDVSSSTHLENNRAFQHAQGSDHTQILGDQDDDDDPPETAVSSQPSTSSVIKISEDPTQKSTKSSSQKKAGKKQKKILEAAKFKNNGVEKSKSQKKAEEKEFDDLLAAFKNSDEKKLEEERKIGIRTELDAWVRERKKREETEKESCLKLLEENVEANLFAFRSHLKECENGTAKYRGRPQCNSLRDSTEAKKATAKRDEEVMSYLRHRYVEVLNVDRTTEVLKFLYETLIRVYDSNMGPPLQPLLQLRKFKDPWVEIEFFLELVEQKM